MTYSQYCRMNVHVSASAKTVLRAAQKMLRKSARYSRENRTARHAWYRDILAEHHKAGQVFRYVMKGAR